MYWLEYRDETKFIGPWPKPVFCGVWTSDLIMRRYLPWWAKPSQACRAYGSLTWYGKYGEGWHWYRLGDDQHWWWPGLKVDVPCGNLINREDTHTTLADVTEREEQEKAVEAALVDSYTAIMEEDPYFFLPVLI